MFQNRTEAGRVLAEHLTQVKDRNPVVVALPRGGVPVGYEVARGLGAPLDILIVRKLGYPGQPELAIGAVVDGKRPEILLNRGLFSDRDLPPRYLDHEIERKLKEIREMHETFRGHRAPVKLEGRTVVIVDDGVATGATMRVVIRRVRHADASQVIVATPVASREAVQLLRREADEVVCISVPDYFGSVGAFYSDFGPVSDDEVKEILDRSARPVS